MDLRELESFRLGDAVKFHNKLNPALWTEKHELESDVKEQLLEIARDFMSELGISSLKVEDITISGSNAAYSYTPHSDLDLHILVDFDKLPDDEIYQELFNAKKTLYNDSHDITVHGVPVELYVQDSNEPVVSLGEYSILKNEWVKIPKKRRANFDQAATRLKYEKIGTLAELALKSANLEKVEKVLDIIKRYRKAGLSKTGEFGPENLAFKALRTKGYIQKLYDLKEKLHSDKLSLDEKINPDVVDKSFDTTKIINLPNLGELKLHAYFLTDFLVPQFRVDVYKDDKKIGYFRFIVKDYNQHNKGLFGIKLSKKDPYVIGGNISVMNEYQKKGIATAVYNFVKELGNDVRPSTTQTAAGKQMWDSFKRTTDEDWHPNDPPPGPETKPTMPKGTVRVDVSDVYDWYKLGQTISNLDRADKSQFGKGPPSTIMAFGDEDIEHKYIQALKQLGLDTTDIDPIDPNQPKDMPRQKVDPTYNVNETQQELDYQGNCTQDDVVEHIFGDVNNFARMVEEHGDEFTINDLVVKYDPFKDIHSFYFKKKKLKETFDKPYPFHLKKDIFGNYLSLVKLKDGSWLEIMFNKQNNDPDDFHIEFLRGRSWSVTGEGDAQRILATVLHATAEFLTHEQPYSITFSASKENTRSGENSESRAKLYDRIVKRYANSWGYNSYQEDQGDQVVYELTKMKEPTNEEAYDHEPLYHATLRAFEPSILKNGLLPGGNLRMFDWSENKHVYLSNYPDIAQSFVDPGVIEPKPEDEEKIFKLMKQGGVVFKIDQNKLDRKNLRADPHYIRDEDEGGETYVYTGTIPPSAIIGKTYFDIDIDESIQESAKESVSPQFIEKYIADIHTGNTSADDETLLQWIHSFDKFKLTTIDLDSVNLKFSGLRSDKVDKYADKSNPPPIVIDGSNNWIIDGYHRANAAKKRGDKTIQAYIGQHDLDESASGYIPSKKEANDPRFKTALTVDVKPDTLQKNAKAFGFKVSRAGIPPLLRK